MLMDKKISEVNKEYDLDFFGDIAYAPTPYNLATKISINGTLIFYDKDKLSQVS